MIIVSKWNSDCKPTAERRLIEIRRECAGKAGANSAVPVIPVATSDMVNKMYKEAKGVWILPLFVVLVSSWFYFILYNQRAIVLPFCLGDKGKTAPDFFPFIPENDLLMSSPGENDVVKRSIVQHTLLSVKGARGAAAPPNFRQLRFFGQREKIWAKSAFKDVSMFI